MESGVCSNALGARPEQLDSICRLENLRNEMTLKLSGNRHERRTRMKHQIWAVIMFSATVLGGCSGDESTESKSKLDALGGTVFRPIPMSTDNGRGNVMRPMNRNMAGAMGGQTSNAPGPMGDVTPSTGGVVNAMGGIMTSTGGMSAQ